MGILKIPRITTTDRSSLTLGLGELVYDTDLDEVYKGDGATTGGIAIGSGAGTVTSVAALTLGTSGTDLSSTVANGTTTPVITLNVPTASATNRGALSSADWSTFNGKQAALSGTGFVKISGTTISYDNSTYLTSNQSITLSGDISGTGTTAITTTIGANKVTNAMLSQVASGSFLGRVTASTGDVETLTGTQATTLLDLFSTTTTTKGLVPGSNNVGSTYFLRADGTWAVPSGGGGSMAIGGSITSATAGSVLFADTGGVLAQDNTNFFWDNTNNRLGLGTASPTTILDVRGAFNFLNTGALTNTLQDVGTFTINSSGTTTANFGQRILFQGRVNTTDSQPWGYITSYLRFYTSPSAWGSASNLAVYNNGAYINVLNISGSLLGTLTVTDNITLNSGGFFASPLSLSHATQVIGGFNNSNSSALTFRTTSGGSPITSQGVFGATAATAGNITFRPDSTYGLVFTAGNGSNHISRATISITNLTNTAGSESGDLGFATQSGGTILTEKMRIFAAGNVAIGTTTNSGYKLEVNGTGKFSYELTTTGRIQAITTKTSSYTIQVRDRVIFADTTSGTVVITLPTHVAGTEFTIMKTDSSANTLSVATTSGLINGSAAWTTTAQYKYITVISNGTNWFIVAGG